MGNFSNFHDMLQDFQKTLRHDDYVQMTDLCTNLIWIETMVTSLDHMDNTMYRYTVYNSNVLPISFVHLSLVLATAFQWYQSMELIYR